MKYTLHNQLNEYYNNNIGNLDKILNPYLNPILYKHLSDIGIINESKYVVRVGSNYYPGLFKSRPDAESCMIKPNHQSDLSTDQQFFIDSKLV